MPLRLPPPLQPPPDCKRWTSQMAVTGASLPDWTNWTTPSCPILDFNVVLEGSRELEREGVVAGLQVDRCWACIVDYVRRRRSDGGVCFAEAGGALDNASELGRRRRRHRQSRHRWACCSTGHGMLGAHQQLLGLQPVNVRPPDCALLGECRRVPDDDQSAPGPGDCDIQPSPVLYKPDVAIVVCTDGRENHLPNNTLTLSARCGCTRLQRQVHP